MSVPAEDPAKLPQHVPAPKPPTGSGTYPAVVMEISRTVELSYSAYVTPDDLERYKQVSDEVMLRILDHNLKSNERAMVEVEAENAHRREMERADQTSTMADQKEGRRLEWIGQWLALVVTLAALAVVAWALYCGHSTTAGVLGTTMVAALAAVFIAGRLMKKSEKPVPVQESDETDEAEED